MFFVLRNDDVKKNCIQYLRDLNGVWKVSITPDKRTNAQNDYMHVLFDEIAPHTGLSAEALKEWMKGKLLGVETVEYKGESYPRTRKTSELNKAECSLFIDELLMMADELGVQLKAKSYYGY